MGTFHPKQVFRQARELEKVGKRRQASSQYASLSAFLRRRGRFKDAKQLIDRAIHLAPESPRLYLQRALCEMGLENEESANSAIQQFARRAIRRKKAESYREYAEQQLKEFPTLRRVLFESLLAIDRTDARYFLSLALVLRELRNLEQAQRVLLDALRTRTMDREVSVLLAEILEEREQGEALGHLRRFQAGELAVDDLILLLSTKPEGKPEAPAEPTQMAEEENNLQTMIRALETQIGFVVEDSIDSVAPLVREFRSKSEKILSGDSKARLDMALAFFEMGLIDAAQDEIRRIPDTDPHFLEGQCLRGEMLCAEGSDLGALEVFQNCLRDERASLEIFCEAKYKLVQIYFRLGDLRQALWQAIELERKAPGYRDLRGLKQQIQEAVGEKPEERVLPRVTMEKKEKTSVTGPSKKTRKLG